MPISAGKGNRLVKKMIRHGYLRMHAVSHGGRGGKVKYLELTEKGYEAIKAEPKPGIGKGAGWEHGFWQHHCLQELKNHEHIQKITIEGMLSNKAIDVLINANEKHIAIEIAMSADNEVSNIEKDIDAGVEKIFIACRDKLVLEKVIALVEGLSPVIKEKTVVCLVQKVVSEVQSYVQHRRNNG
jgi:DNA-binding PadR family transcriptional regulator